MRFWAFDLKYFKRDDSSILLESVRKVWISEGDKIIFFNRFNKGIVFQSSTTVSSTALEDLGEEGFRFKGILSKLRLFQEDRHLEEFSFSLQKIYRYQKPMLHFKRPYIELSENDFKTLVKATIYWARTGFGQFINQLPHPHLVRFMRGLAESEPDILLQRSGYSNAWKALRRFIEEEYISAALVFKAIRIQVEKLNQLPEFNLEYSDVSLSSDEDIQPDFVEQQERLFSEFSEMLVMEDSQIDVLHEIDRRVKEEHISEEIFEKIFAGTTWPIQMIEN